MPRTRRSMLFVSGNDPKALDRARASGADSLILDLEDTVTADRKGEARALVASFLSGGGPEGAERTVRVNAFGTEDLARDLDAIIPGRPDALVVPKTSEPRDVRVLATRLARLERRAGIPAGSVKLLPLIETPLGVLNAYPIATASPRVDALVIGHVDLSRTLGIREAGAMDGVILHARCQLVLAARAAGLDAIDAVYMSVDADGLAAETRQGLALGFAGKLCAHPTHVAIVHAAYAPSDGEVDYARRLVAAFDAHVASGHGIFVFEGRVIDLPVVEAERSVLARAAAARA
jgi:citrate lyase subunit beta / citryl-CoA lyase